MSFTARHDSEGAEAAVEVLDRLETFRAELERIFAVTPGEVAVVLHSHDLQLALAHPWMPLARAVSAPAARRYFAGWFAKGEIHALAPHVLAGRASRVPGSREALELAPLHEYAHLVLGLNNASLPPPFSPRSFARYLRWAWLCEGAATHFCGQTRYLRPALVRRLKEGAAPAFPPVARDALLLGGTIFTLLERGAGTTACVTLASTLDPAGPRAAIERAFSRPVEEVEEDWREYLEGLLA